MRTKPSFFNLCFRVISCSAISFCFLIPFSLAEQIKFSIPFDIDQDDYRIEKLNNAGTIEFSDHPALVPHGGIIRNYLGMRELADVALELLRAYMAGEEGVLRYDVVDSLMRSDGDGFEYWTHRLLTPGGIIINQEWVRQDSIVFLNDLGPKHYQKFKFYEKKAKNYRRVKWA